MNEKRAEAIWLEERLRVPRRLRKTLRVSHSTNGIARRRLERANHVWNYDFVSDQAKNGRTLKIFVVPDDSTRRALPLAFDRSCTSARRDRDVGGAGRGLRRSRVHQNGAWPLVHRRSGPVRSCAVEKPRALHRAGYCLGQQLRRELRRPASRRAAEQRAVHNSDRGTLSAETVPAGA